MSEINFEGLPPLSKTYILRYVSQEDIFKRYTGLDVVENYPYTSPFREDRNPGCNFYYDSKGTVRFNDHAGYFHGDCFDAVGFAISVDSSTKEGFKRVLEDIAQKFRLHKYANEETLKQALYNKLVQKKVKLDKTITIDVLPREWNNRDKEFWKKIKATGQWLKYFNVYPCQEVWLNKNLKYEYDDAWDLAYCYDFGKGRKRIYFPYRKKYRFLGNTSIIQGIDKLTVERACVITKSYKDVIAIRIVAHKYFPINAVAPSSETYKLNQEDYRQLLRRNDYLFSLYDFDRKGQFDRTSVGTAIWMRKHYNIVPMFFTNGNFNSFNYRVKDFSEYLERFGIDKARKLMERVYNYYEETYMDVVDNEINKQLKWLRDER